MGAVALVAVGVLIGTLLNSDKHPQNVAMPVMSTPGTGALSPTSSTTPRSSCAADYSVTNLWPNGYQVEVTIRDKAGRGLTGWSVSWRLPSGENINNLWNGSLSRNGNTVTVRNVGYNSVLSARGTTTFGFIAATSGSAPGQPDVTCVSS